MTEQQIQNRVKKGKVCDKLYVSDWIRFQLNQLVVSNNTPSLHLNELHEGLLMLIKINT